MIQTFQLQPGITRPQCMCYSDTSHLYAAGHELMYNNHTPY